MGVGVQKKLIIIRYGVFIVVVVCFGGMGVVFGIYVGEQVVKLLKEN